MKDFTLWKFIHEKLLLGERVVLIAVLNSKGSSPGKAGFKMAVAANNQFIGTMGGGEMELKILEQCRKILSSNRKVCKLEKLYHSSSTNKLKSGLICAGTQTIFTCSLSKTDLNVILKIIDIYESKGIGILKYSDKGIVLNIGAHNPDTILLKNENNPNWTCEENIGILNTIYIAGGGHMGLALARQMEILGFYVVIFDERKEIKTISDNVFADEIIITAYENIGEFIKEGNYSYAAVVTSSYLSDKKALKQILKKKLKYIGLMGSAAKIKKIFEELKADGVKQKDIKKVHAPIGIKIKAETVEEIAVSIAAEMIRIKNFRE